MMRPFVAQDAFRQQCGIASYFTTAWKCSRQPRDIDLKRFEATLVGDFIAMVTRHTLARVCRSTARDRRRGDYVVDASLPVRHGKYPPNASQSDQVILAGISNPFTSLFGPVLGSGRVLQPMRPDENTAHKETPFKLSIVSL